MHAAFSILAVIWLVGDPQPKTSDQVEIERLHKEISRLAAENVSLKQRASKAEKKAMALADENDRLRRASAGDNSAAACAAHVEALFREVVRRGNRPKFRSGLEAGLAVIEDVMEEWIEDRPEAREVFGRTHAFLKDWLGPYQNIARSEAEIGLPSIYESPAALKELFTTANRADRKAIGAAYGTREVLWRGQVTAVNPNKSSTPHIEFIADGVIVRAQLAAVKKDSFKGIEIGTNIAVRGVIYDISGAAWTGITVELGNCNAVPDPTGFTYPPRRRWP